ncbi:carboxylesterase family protein [Plantibacter sp. VKM Ac-2876]|uniref:carboxylesterase family protein n=1 Tax=Plantibacter sp. VKM Ac-2876 TaxID=2783826 RepID=UPI00188A0792|nr:carboxylesterase family protein [Plantibacter sp. VKM Ac-2876]MBF4565969.1 carboxylesterase family protein [Plantibacter sp. VKM Ac-2876]
MTELHASPTSDAPGTESSATPPPADARAFETSLGTILGRVDGAVVRARGIPYARAGRFEVPQPTGLPVGADGDPVPFRAFERAPASPQRSSRVLEAVLEGAGEGMVDSEDCQALSITLPADVRPDESLPVMVWIHGGAYVTGAGDLDVYDPISLVVEQRVIVVSVTYRLGILGFLGDGETLPANLGLLDLVLALRWVHEHIAAFGGDPGSVTLFGQSAGGDAIAHLMISDGTAGLFQRAIVQSAPLGISSGRAKMASAMMRAAGSPTRDTPVVELLALEEQVERAARRFGLRGGMAFGTQYGHAPLPAEADRDAAWREAASRIDVLIGSTTEETRLYVPLIPAFARMTSMPLVGDPIRRALVGATTHVTYTRDARKFVERHRASGGRATRYELSWAPPGSPYGASHVTDLPLLLGTERSWSRTALIGSATWAEVDRRGRFLRQMWADFARDGVLAADATAGLSDVVTLDR